MAAAKKRNSNSRPSDLVTTSYDPEAKDNRNAEVESPSLSTPSARARFEFEKGKSNEGTKILMLEWEDDASTLDIRGSWTVSWEGKSHVLPAEERKDATSSQGHRLFFLLPPGVSVPATVTLTLRPEDASKGEVVWRTNPLPAIFPPGLYEPAVGGNSRRPSKGVLHTLWAKKRLQTLQSEIDKEIRDFPEGIGLEMAVREKEWIEESFSIPPLEINNSAPHRLSLKNLGEVPLSPGSPLSPGGSRLAEKLKGLKLQTKEGELQRRDSSQTGADASRGPFSPDDEDIAVPSYSAFRGANPGVLAATPAQTPETNATVKPPVIAKPIAPPAAMPRAQGVDSIAGMMAGTGLSTAGAGRHDDEDEGELFAMPLSPRSPEMTKSPFSFASSDTGKYLKREVL